MTGAPKHGEKWRHPSFGVGTVEITPKGITVRFGAGWTTNYPSTEKFLQDRMVRA